MNFKMSDIKFGAGVEKNLKSVKEDFKKHGVFYSSDKMAQELKALLPQDVKEVYDPTCGAGSLLKVFDDDVKKYGQELDAGQAEIAQNSLKNAEVIAGDTLVNPAFKTKKFKAIIANPPFSVKWDADALKNDERFKCLPALPPKSKADYAFIAHILNYLADDGIAVCLCFPGVTYRGNAEGKIRKWLIERNFIKEVHYFQGDYFVDTKIATVALVLSKHKTTRDILFYDHEKNLKRAVTAKEIADHGFCLSVSSYVQEEKKKEPYDSKSEAINSVERFKKRLALELKYFRSVNELEKILFHREVIDFTEFKADLHSIISKG